MDKLLNRYNSTDITIIVPTYNRPEKVGKFLNSIRNQSQPCGRILVVDGGDSAEKVVASFKEELPVEYYIINPPGQIRQRNHGIASLDNFTRLVAFFDDDIILEPDAIDEMVVFWNLVEPNTAGVGFNVVNVPEHRYSMVKGVFHLDHQEMGRVLKSGMNTGINNVKADIRTQWLGGGYTVWRREVLAEYPQAVLNTRWAVGEDLRYSYPIGKKFPLYVCSQAKVHHHHVYDQAQATEVARYRGKKIVFATLFFVLTNNELSLTFCYWMLLGLSLGKFVNGIGMRDRHHLKEALGQLEGLLYSWWYTAGNRNIKSLLEDE